MILSAQTIRSLSKLQPPMVFPFCERGVVRGRSYGLSSCGYDVRVNLGTSRYLQRDWKISKSSMGRVRKFLLVSTMEKFNMPPDVMAVVHDKSSWARQGLAVQNTVIEPGWRGHLTLELTYHNTDELVICQGDPIAQIVFHRLDRTTEQPYVGKYQDQEAGPQEVRFE